MKKTTPTEIDETYELLNITFGLFKKLGIEPLYGTGIRIHKESANFVVTMKLERKKGV